MENEFVHATITPQTAIPEDAQKQAKKHFSKLGLMFFFGTLIIYAVQFVASMIAGAINPDLLTSTGSSLLITMIPMYAIAMPLMGLLIRRVPATQLEKKNMSIGQGIIAFLMCYGGMYVSNLIGVFITQMIGVIKGSAVENTMLNIVTTSDLWVNFLIMVICAPIAEELIFRKLLIDRTAAYGEKVSVLLSGLMFGLFHGNLNQFVYAFVLGAFFAFIYVKTGKIIYSIILHMIINFMGSVLGMIVLNYVGEEFINAANDPAALMAYMMENMSVVIVYLLYSLALVILAITGIIIFIVNTKKIRFNPGKIALPKGKVLSTTVLNLGMGLFVLFWLLMILIQLFA